MHRNAQSSNVYESQTVEGAEMPFRKRMHTDGSIYTTEYYSGIRKDEYPTLASIWMELEQIMLNEVSQAEQDNHRVVSLICGT